MLKAADLDVVAQVEGMQSFVFGSNFAKAWYEEYGGGDEFGETHRKIKEVDPEWLVTFFDAVLARLDENAGQRLERDKNTQSQ